jgi:drug/metabolite transporter (DMT)-like permease
MVIAAATFFGINGPVSKVALSSGLSSLRLTEARSAGAFVGLMLFALLWKRSSLRLEPGEWKRVALFGVVGVAFVQLFYFLAIHRLAIGIALLIQYLGPLMVQLWRGVTLDGLGVVFALIGAFVFATYLLLAEREVARRDTITLLAWGFLFATLFWTVVQPWWSFPAATMGKTVSLQGRLAGWHLPVWALVLWVIVLGAIVPFVLIVGALRHVSATRVGIAAMLEPVVATVVAWLWLRESLSAAQLAGAAVVLGGVALAQTAR